LYEKLALYGARLFNTDDKNVPNSPSNVPKLAGLPPAKRNSGIASPSKLFLRAHGKQTGNIE